MHRLAPKPWRDPGTASAIKDMLDGYFPLALKKEFPDGVPLKVGVAEGVEQKGCGRRSVLEGV